jgi:hypothetical protein
MLAYHGDPEIKATYLERVRQHAERPDLDALEMMCQEHKGPYTFDGFHLDAPNGDPDEWDHGGLNLDTYYVATAEERPGVAAMVAKANALPALIAYARCLEAERREAARTIETLKEQVLTLEDFSQRGQYQSSRISV